MDLLSRFSTINPQASSGPPFGQPWTCVQRPGDHYPGAAGVAQPCHVAGNRFNDSAFPVTDRTYEQDSDSFLTKDPPGLRGGAPYLPSACGDPEVRAAFG